jgi:hypothetical protein
VRVAAAPATLTLVVNVAADLTLAVGLGGRERTSDGLVGNTLAGETLTAGRIDPMLVAAAGGEVVTTAALLVVEATVVVAVETTAFVVVATVEAALVVVAATVETAFVVVATVDLAIATVDATVLATDAPANRAADRAGQNAAAIKTPAAMGPANHLVLTCLMAPPKGLCS